MIVPSWGHLCCQQTFRISSSMMLYFRKPGMAFSMDSALGGIRVQQLAQQQDLGRVAELGQLCVAEVVVVAAKGDAIKGGEVIQHG